MFLIPILILAVTGTAANAQIGASGKSIPDSNQYQPTTDVSTHWLCCGASGQSLAEEIKEPFFAFILSMVEADSTGRWTGLQLQAYADSLGRPSRIPLASIASLECRSLAGETPLERMGLRANRVWSLELVDDLKVRMPYSILGYHPGDLFLSNRISISEWRIGEANFHVTIEDFLRVLPAQGLTVFRFDAGEIVLDADGLIDRLLGKKLDDSWTEGFAVGRVDGDLIGLALSVGRKGRKIYGEFDFCKDKVIVHGRPLAGAMSRYCRRWVQPLPGETSRAWQNYE